MIFDELVLENFGPYAGRQEIKLTPPAHGKPVVLFGGMNGGGKTTILDAFQLLFYGKRARCSNRGRQSYAAFLKQCVHRGASESGGARVELLFRAVSEGCEHSYRICRSWTLNNGSTKETVNVLKNGDLDKVLTEAWNEHAEEFLPFSISPLFFFDGEKIEEFADLENSGKILSTAVNSLLGLDIVDKLAKDLAVLERRTQLSKTNSESQKRIRSAADELQELTKTRTNLKQDEAHLRTQLDRKNKLLRDIETKFRAEGGEFYERRHEIEERRNERTRGLEQQKDVLRSLAEGSAPLLLVHGLLCRAERRSIVESEAAEQRAVSEVLTERDSTLIEILRKYDANRDLLEAVETYMDCDRREREDRADTVPYLDVTDKVRRQLHVLADTELERTFSEVYSAVAVARKSDADLVDIERTLAGIPHEDAMEELLQERETATQSVRDTQAELQLLETKMEQLNSTVEHRQRKLASLIEKAGKTRAAQKGADRIVVHSRKARATLDTFRRKVLQKNIRCLEQLILEGFCVLLRKKSLVSNISIDPDTFSITLTGRNGKNLPTDRLSAGERQLLAVAMLWGLGRASGRPLPTIIDTPLGRLDSEHRTHLISRYFPHASHQVVLLSTDEEIDEGYYKKLKQWVGRSYLLNYDEKKDSTEVVPGYFWE